MWQTMPLLIENSTRSPSFVRSITMDKWFDDQLKKMEVHVACTVMMGGELFLTCWNIHTVGRKRKGKNLL